MRNGSLWSNIVFEKEVIFHELDLRSRNQASESTQLCLTRVFFPLIISQLRREVQPFYQCMIKSIKQTKRSKSSCFIKFGSKNEKNKRQGASKSSCLIKFVHAFSLWTSSLFLTGPIWCIYQCITPRKIVKGTVAYVTSLVHFLIFGILG